jgi:hypothetical protein
LLTQGFDDPQLRQLAFDWPKFRPAYEKLTANTRKDVLVQLLIEQAERTLQMDKLLALAQQHNPARYAAHQPYRTDAPLTALLAGQSAPPPPPGLSRVGFFTNQGLTKSDKLQI